MPARHVDGGRVAADIESDAVKTASALLVAAMVLLGLSPAQALQVTDDRGITIRFDKTPQRIVSLLPSLTETVCEIGRAHV